MANRLNDVFQLLVPKDKKFFPLFREASSNVLVSAQALHDALRADSVTRINAHKEMDRIEQQGDEFTHSIIRESVANFIVPFDREDIHNLAVKLDDVVDYIYAVSKRIELYKIYHFPAPMLAMSEALLEGVKALDLILQNFHTLDFTDDISLAISTVRLQEKKVEECYDQAILALFQQEIDAMELMKFQEVYVCIAGAADKMEETASVLEGILLKYT
jgi:uncharacterized protein